MLLLLLLLPAWPGCRLTRCWLSATALPCLSGWWPCC